MLSQFVIYVKRIAIISIPAVITFCCFWPYRKRALDGMKLKTSVCHEIGLICLLVSIFGLLAITLWPAYYWDAYGNPWIWGESEGCWGNLYLLIGRPTWLSDVNFIPFRQLYDYWNDIREDFFQIIPAFVNLFGNIAMFIPLGFFVSLLFRKPTWKRALAVGGSLSLLIEVLQYFIIRNSDVDDLIINIIGSLCGYWIYVFLKKHCPLAVKKFQCESLDCP